MKRMTNGEKLFGIFFLVFCAVLIGVNYMLAHNLI